MNKQKLIKFLAYLGIESAEFTNQINESQFDLTLPIFMMISPKIDEPLLTIQNWYDNFNPNPNDN